MNLSKNKIFALVICLVAFVISGLIFADRVLGALSNATVSVASVFNMGGQRIKNVAAPIDPTDAATRSWVESRGVILENRTSDPIGATVGQMWIRTDQ